MINVYSANSSIEAHLVKNLLAQHGIEAHVSGYYLQGGIGELPVFDLIQVRVAENDEFAARNVIRDYEAGAFALDDDD
jgi:formyltetrahydrofolate synthetase